MKIQRIAIAVTIVNLALMVVLFTKMNPAIAQQKQTEPKIIRAQGLEITDSMGKTRASITLYPEAVVFRLIDSKGKPVVKLAAEEDGGGISLSEASNGYVQIVSRDSGGFLKIKNSDGKEQLIKP